VHIFRTNQKISKPPTRVSELIMKILIPSTDARLGKSIVNLLAKQLPLKTLDATVFPFDSAEEDEMLAKIREAAEENQSDLIVLVDSLSTAPSRDHAYRAFLRFMHDSPCPVLFIHDYALQLKTEHERRILIALDQKPESEMLIRFLTRSDFILPGTIKLLHVLEKPSSICQLLPAWCDLHDDEIAQRRIWLRKQALALRCHYHSPKIEELVLEGNARTMIAEYAREWQADALILGFHQPGKLDNIFHGNVAISVLQQADCPVLVFGTQTLSGSGKSCDFETEALLPSC